MERENQIEMIKKYGNKNSCYVPFEGGGVADFSYPESTTRRGRVQGGGDICPTITSEGMWICKIELAKEKTSKP